MKTKHFIGIDIGGTKILAGLVNEKGEILNHEKTATPCDATAKDIVYLINDLIDDVLYPTKIKLKNISGIGLGVPGLVSLSGKIIRTPNMCLSGFNLVKELKKRLKMKIVIGNDVNMGLMGEHWLGGARNYNNVLSLFVGTGLGAAAIVENRLLLGANGVACEIGHMIVGNDGVLCSCGNKGCLEAYVGRWAIEKAIKKEILTGRHSIVTSMIDQHHKVIKSKILAKGLEKKDPVVTEVMHKAAHYLGLAAISLRHIFDPEAIVFGGGVIEACGKYMLPVIENTLRKDKLFLGIRDCAILPSKLGDDAVVLGSVAAAKH
ncbi:MAG: ROK family protein [Candidatus Omnitrophica bacterium]|nr:ROK family protein [Candidatus Omnitrophota bacterium]